jgi:hypothetical protein
LAGEGEFERKIRPMKLIHYSKMHLAAVHSVTQDGNHLFKPVGLWVSIPGDDDWPSWCRAEEFGLAHLACETEVVLADSAKMLVISDAVRLDAFHRQFNGAPIYLDSDIGWPDWHAVARIYDGIIIAPYLWRRRLVGDASRWYYSWDCASGCIWNADAVAKLIPLTPSSVEVERPSPPAAAPVQP